MQHSESKVAGRRRMLAAAVFAAGAFAASGALGYGEQGFYTGAYALIGEGGCAGAGMGVNPTGGCTPGVDALTRSEAFATGIRGPANQSGAIADLSLSRLSAYSIFPDGASNLATGAANLTETFTVHGDLPTDTVVTVSLRLGSVVTGGGGYGTLQVRLATNGAAGSGNSYFFRYPNCAWAGGEPCSTASGWIGRDVVRTVTVNDANRSFRVDASLDAAGGGSPGGHSTDAWCKIKILLPEGLTATSASGVWYAPEPSQGAVSLAGVLALGAVSGRRRRRPARSLSARSMTPCVAMRRIPIERCGVHARRPTA